MKWLNDLGMVVNAAKTELMVFDKDVREMDVMCDGNNVRSAPEMGVLGITFDNRLNWEAQLKRTLKTCQRFKPALRALKQKLTKREFLQVVTSHYFSKLYYCSEMWFPVMSAKFKKQIASAHFYPLRLSVNDYYKRLSRFHLCKITKRASPDELSDFKVAKMMISISNNACPFALFNEILSHAVVERRKPFNPTFLDMSRTKIGRQSLANRLSNVSKKTKFEWLYKQMSKDTLRVNLKKTFFCTQTVDQKQ